MSCSDGFVVVDLAFTVTVQLAETDEFPIELQVITAVPSLRALTVPFSTLTTLLSEDDQETDLL